MLLCQKSDTRHFIILSCCTFIDSKTMNICLKILLETNWNLIHLMSTEIIVKCRIYRVLFIHFSSRRPTPGLGIRWDGYDLSDCIDIRSDTAYFLDIIFIWCLIDEVRKFRKHLILIWRNSVFMKNYEEFF